MMLFADGGVAAAPSGNGALPPGSGPAMARGTLHGEDNSISYNVENPTIDLETYAQGYSGLARLYRLRFIAHHCPSLRVEALRLAIAYVMTTHNTALFNELQKKLAASVSNFCLIIIVVFTKCCCV